MLRIVCLQVAIRFTNQCPWNVRINDAGSWDVHQQSKEPNQQLLWSARGKINDYRDIKNWGTFQSCPSLSTPTINDSTMPIASEASVYSIVTLPENDAPCSWYRIFIPLLCEGRHSRCGHWRSTIVQFLRNTIPHRLYSRYCSCMSKPGKSNPV